jgi:hypothetical protein
VGERTKEIVNAEWTAARREAHDAAERSRQVYAKSRGPRDPLAIAAKEVAEKAIARRDALRAELNAFGGGK